MYTAQEIHETSFYHINTKSSSLSSSFPVREEEDTMDSTSKSSYSRGSELWDERRFLKTSMSIHEYVERRYRIPYLLPPTEKVNIGMCFLLISWICFARTTKLSLLWHRNPSERDGSILSILIVWISWGTNDSHDPFSFTSNCRRPTVGWTMCGSKYESTCVRG